jgi:glycosyltransferase involved in cell wall biosynthesis
MNRLRPLRVLHIVQFMKGYGAERQLAELLPRLQSPDVDVRLLTVYAPSKDELPVPSIAVECAQRSNRRDFTFIGRLIDRIRAFDPDVVHTHTVSGKYWGRLAAAVAGVQAIVYTEHNPCVPHRSPLQRLASRALNRYTSRCVTFFPEQGGMLAQLDGVSQESLCFIPNGLAFEQMSRPNREQCRSDLDLDTDFAITVVGRLHHQKNHDLAIRAIATMETQQRSGITVLFAGSGVLEPELRQLARKLGVADRVRFLGYRNDVANVLAASDLLLMTSHYEGMPLSLIEGMYQRVPILTTPWLGSRSMLQDAELGRVAKGWDPHQLALDIARAREERDASARMAEAAYRYALAEYSIEKMVASHRRLYDDLASSVPRAA